MLWGSGLSPYFLHTMEATASGDARTFGKSGQRGAGGLCRGSARLSGVELLPDSQDCGSCPQSERTTESRACQGSTLRVRVRSPQDATWDSPLSRHSRRQDPGVSWSYLDALLPRPTPGLSHSLHPLPNLVQVMVTTPALSHQPPRSCLTAPGPCPRHSPPSGQDGLLKLLGHDSPLFSSLQQDPNRKEPKTPKAWSPVTPAAPRKCQKPGASQLSSPCRTALSHVSAQLSPPPQVSAQASPSAVPARHTAEHPNSALPTGNPHTRLTFSFPHASACQGCSHGARLHPRPLGSHMWPGRGSPRRAPNTYNSTSVTVCGMKKAGREESKIKFTFLLFDLLRQS